MQRELSKYFVSQVKLFLHTIFRSNGLKNKVPKVLNLYYPRENHLQPLLSCDHQGGVGGFPAGKVPGPIYNKTLLVCRWCFDSSGVIWRRFSVKKVSDVSE